MVLVHPARPPSACLAGSNMALAWVLVPASPPWCLLPWVRAGPRPDLLSSRQVYFFCSASACTPSGLETCSTTCSSGPASESGLGHHGGWGLHSHIRRPVLAPGQPGAGAQAVCPSLPRPGRRRAYAPHSNDAERQNLVSSPGPVGFEGSYRQKPPPGTTGTRAVH